MPSGSEIARENEAKFKSWVQERYASDDWISYVRGEKLNRSEIARECNFAKSVLRQNPAVKSELQRLEENLSQAGVLSPATNQRDANHLSETRATSDKRRLNLLEQQNQALLAEIASLKEQLKKFSLLDDYLSETGRLPR